MRIAYGNTYFHTNHTGGGHVHMGQFVSNAVALGHEIWAWPRNQHPAVKVMPTSAWGLTRALRGMDVLYVRIERTPVRECRWALPPYRTIYRLPVVVWEFNTHPYFGILRGKSEVQVKQAVQTFRQLGRGCDLAVCVSQALADYVQEELGIRCVAVVPNGSDPELFRPDATPVKRIPKNSDQLNVVWIGSAGIAYHDFALLRKTADLLWQNIADRQIVFHIIGDGLNERMAEMPPNVNYYGGQRYETLPHWLAVMDVGLGLMSPGPGDYNSPLKLFDYMASGLAVVSTNQPQVRDVFEMLGQLDLLVSADDPKSLADALRRLAIDRERVNRQGLAGRQLVIDHYNWRRAVADTMDEIEKILNEKQKR